MRKRQIGTGAPHPSVRYVECPEAEASKREHPWHASQHGGTLRTNQPGYKDCNTTNVNRKLLCYQSPPTVTSVGRLSQAAEALR